MPNRLATILEPAVALMLRGPRKWIEWGNRLIATGALRRRLNLPNRREAQDMSLQEIMSKPAVTCRSSDTLNTAAKLMWEHDCGAIPVVGEDGGIVGMLTDRDICMAAYTQGATLQAIPVSNAMAKQVFSCHEDDSLEALEHLMSEKRIRRVPIVDASNRPLGIVSLNDIARRAAAAPRKKDGLAQELTKTLAAICQPRPPREASSQQPRAQPQIAQA